MSGPPRDTSVRLDGLHAIVQAGAVLAAIPAPRVERMVLPDDVTGCPGGADRIGAEELPAFDLGSLLGLAPAGGARVIVSTRSGRLALAVGACVAVRFLGPGSPLPPALGGRGIGAVFAFGEPLRPGLVLDLDALLAVSS